MGQRLYPNGFMFSDEIVSDLPHYYKTKKIIDQFHYYFDNNVTPVIYVKNDNFIIIHGHFVHVGLENSIEKENLPKYLLNNYFNNYGEFLNTLDFVGGRYAIMIGNKEKVEIYQDATGARSVYYMTDRNVIVSHIHMINDSFQCKENDIANIITPLKISFDSTLYDNVKSLVPNFKLELYQKKVTRYFPREKNKYFKLPESTRISYVESLWKKQLDYYVNRYDNIILSLTGGNDSRVSLAMANTIKDKINFFTYAPDETVFDENNKSHVILNKDKIIVNQIIRDINLNHRFFNFIESDKNLPENIKNIISKNTPVEHNPFLIQHYLKSFNGDNTLHIRANLLEIGRAYFITPQKSNISDEVYKTFLHGIKRFITDDIEIQAHKFIKDSISTMGYDEYLHDYHVLDLYYWENRTGRWHSEVLNETDIAFETMLPFNMRGIIELSLSFPIQKRKSNYLFKELINKNLALLNFYGENNTLNVYEQEREKEKNLSEKNTFIKHFYVFNKANENIQKFSANDNVLYLPKEHLTKGSYSYFDYIFSKDYGHLSLDILSKYSSTQAYNYLEYSLYKNQELLLVEDIASWNLNNAINIFNLKKDDIVTIKVTTLKTIPFKSWENASRIQVLNIQEHNSREINDSKITFTSPFSLVQS